MSVPPEAWVLMVKAPVPGRVKTRLCPPLSPEEAAELQAAFLSDLGTRLQRNPPPCAVYAAVFPGEKAEEVVALLGGGVEAFPQEGQGLAERMDRAFQKLLVRGHRRVILTGSDLPFLHFERHIRPALEALGQKGTDVVIAPDGGGGYFLVGVKAFHPGLLDATMSTGSNFLDTLQRVTDAGLSVDILSASLDVDTIQDLGRMMDLLESGREDSGDLPRTAPLARSLWERVGRRG